MTSLHTLEQGRAYSDREEDEDDQEIMPVNEESVPLEAEYDDDVGDVDDSPPAPRFLQDEGEYKRWKWVPPRLRRLCSSIATWSKGPKPPQIQRIHPWFPETQEAPLRLLNAYVPKKKGQMLLLTAVYFCWILLFSLILRESRLASELEGYGRPTQISCGASYFSPKNFCGLHGNECRPFNGTAFAFKCPANCRETMLLNPRAVGADMINYRPLVVGGPASDDERAHYRGDSFICGSAIHAGIIDNDMGGCGALEKTGQHSNFVSSKHHDIRSIAFDSYFPLSFSFNPGFRCKSKDLRWPLFAVSGTFTIMFSLFVSSPSLFFFTMFVSLFFHTGLASDPPNHNTMLGLISNLLGKFLPAMFCAFVMYRFMGVQRSLTGLTAQIEKTILWLGGAWIGCLNNYTFGHIPIERLTSHDLKQQPGAVPALIIVITILALIVIQQVYYFQKEGRLLRYLCLYGLFIGSILLSLMIPGLNLRIHHYILALLFLPGTSMQTRPALLYQGILIGLFINGIARWGFDPVLQTTEELRGDGQWNSLLPTIFEPVIQLGNPSIAFALSNITFTWPIPPAPFDGVSVLVNDVERYRGYTDEGGIGGLWGEAASLNVKDPHVIPNQFFWERKADLKMPEYFRFGFLEGRRGWDYTKAATWTADGEYVPMQKGPSKV